jgi:hypothetical protein
MDKQHIYDYDKIKQCVSQMKLKIIKLTPNSIYKNNKYILSYDQVIISVKYSKLQNYKKRVKELMETTKKDTGLLEELLLEIDECIHILEPLKHIEIKDITLLDFELDFDTDS